MASKEKVTCRRCELVQYAADACRRCGRLFPAANPASVPAPETVRSDAADEVTEGIAASVDASRGAGIAWGERLPTMRELQGELIAEAFRRSNKNALDAARMIGVGKTTLYRRIKTVQQVQA